MAKTSGRRQTAQGLSLIFGVSWTLRTWTLIIAAMLFAGCARWGRKESTPRSLLRPATAANQSVTLEIFFVRMPYGDESANGPLWQHVDEQELPAVLRQQMVANGFRAGVVGAHVPTPLAKLLQLNDEQAPVDDRQPKGVSLVAEPEIRRRLMQLRTGDRGEIMTSKVYDELPLLLHDEGHVRGRTYESAQGMLAVVPAVEPDGRIRLKLTPELHYGQPQQTWKGSEGVMHMMMARPKEVFDQLELEPVMSPGQMLVMTCRPQRSGSLGYYFFSEKSPRGHEQKLLVIRLIGTPRDTLTTNSSSSQ